MTRITTLLGLTLTAVLFYQHDGAFALLLTQQIPSDWVEYTPGTCNVIISAPHGGSKRVSEIADRTDGCLGGDGVTCIWEKSCSPKSSGSCGASTAKDSYTQEIAAMVVQHLRDTYNCAPHFVRSNLHRSIMDPNRETGEGTQGDAKAREAWVRYNDQYMATAVGSVKQKSGKGIVIDFHGQGHPEGWTEVGYLVSGYYLTKGVSDLQSSSIRSLAARSGGISPTDLLSGPLSFGAFLQARGQLVVPSPAHKSPAGGNYFSGGYIVKRYGSRDNNNGIDGLQLEIPKVIRFDKDKREAFAADVAAAIDQFRHAHGYV